MRIGPHVNDNGQTDALIAYCARVKPPVIKMLAPAADIIARVKAVSPGTRVVGRVVWDPQTLDAYGDFQKRTLSRAREVGHGVDWWEGFNEHITDDAPATYIRKFADAEVGLAKRLLDAGFGAAIGGFSTGVLDDREIDPFMQALQFCHDNSGRVLFHFHEYSGPYMQFGVKTADGKNQQPHGSGFTGATTDPRLLEAPDLRGWLTLRYRDLWDILQRRGLTGVRMLISESGIDNVTNRPGGQGRGWRDFHNTEWSRLPGIGDYADQMAWYARQLSHDAYIIGAVDFGWGAVSQDWQSFDLTRDPDMLRRFIAAQAAIGGAHPAPAPVPPTPAPQPPRVPPTSPIPPAVTADHVVAVAAVKGEGWAAFAQRVRGVVGTVPFATRAAWAKEVKAHNGLPADAGLEAGRLYRSPWHKAVPR